MKRYVGIIFAVLCLCCGVRAQIKVIPMEKLEAIGNPKLSEDASSLRFETMRIVAEPMNEDDGIRTFVYKFRNEGADTVAVRRLVTSCSCVSASCVTPYVAPGCGSEVVLRYDPKGHPGRFERKVFVYTGDGDSPSAILVLSVNVEVGSDLSGLYPYSMGNLRLRRVEVCFTEGLLAVEKCVCVNAGDKAIRLKTDMGMLPPYLTVTFHPEVMGPGEEGKIIIGYDPSKGGERESAMVFLTGTGVSPGQSVIKVKMKKQ